ncbi:hypothetical protein LX77_02148 [Gelidibacter algens]|uniref:Uncharacterized protein n=1 Tax=Gelidibacter algens TaxID=49280 RepID=A0A327S1U3_9FLAO|nr:hypothetical protein [Gelidibacter algens]RAJ22989.1 hypothetical protein LX77_02148 [Gelidibacter algens]
MVDSIFDVEIKGEVDLLKTQLKIKLNRYSHEQFSTKKEGFKSKYGTISNKVFVVQKKGYKHPMLILPMKNSKEVKLLIGYFKKDNVNYKIFESSDAKSTKGEQDIELEILNNLSVYFRFTSTNEKINQNISNRSSDCWRPLGQSGSNSCYMGMQDMCTGDIIFIDTCGKMEEDEEEWEWGDEDDPWEEDDYDDGPDENSDGDEWNWNDGGGDIDDFKVVNELTGKALCVYEKLKNSNSNLFKETIGKFIDDPKYDLILKNGNCSSGASACTNSQSIGSTGEVIITIDQLSGSILEDAALILHEGIHAEIARYVHRFQVGEDPNNRARLFQLYKFYKEAEVPEKHLDHPYMTLNYINPIASALRTLDGNRYPIDYYKSFAWDGLRKWDVSNLLGIEGPPKLDGYRNIVNSNTNLSCD